MDYAYPKSVVVIVDSLENYSAACHLFSNQFPNANLISAHHRINLVHHQLVAPITPTQTPVKPATETQLLIAQQYILNSLGDPDYYVKDIENAMVKAEKNNKNKIKLFHVVVMIKSLFSPASIRRLKARKIYFYENRNEKFDVPVASDFCSNVKDDYDSLGFAGSMVNISNSVKTIYTQYGFEV